MSFDPERVRKTEAVLRNSDIPGTEEFIFLEECLRAAEPYAEAVAAAEQLSGKDMSIVINTRA